MRWIQTEDQDVCENVFRAEMITFPMHGLSREPAETEGYRGEQALPQHRARVERIPSSELESEHFLVLEYQL